MLTTNIRKNALLLSVTHIVIVSSTIMISCQKSNSDPPAIKWKSKSDSINQDKKLVTLSEEDNKIDKGDKSQELVFDPNDKYDMLLTKYNNQTSELNRR